MLKQVAYNVYERSMARSIRREPGPRCIALVIADADLVDAGAIAKLATLAGWCCEIGIAELLIYVSITVQPPGERLAGQIEDTFAGAGFPGKIVSEGRVRELGGDRPCRVNVSIGYGGKHELTNALREALRAVQRGEIQPRDIDEALIEKHLIFQSEPDLFIRTGEERLSDFLIWQSVYSELYFTDVNWEDFRKVDLLRAVRDYQYRQRRFGR